MTVLVTGGAGYIGAHVVRLLQQAGHGVLVVDDLSFGSAERVGGAPLLQLDLAAAGATELLTQAMAEYQVQAVIHFASRKQVGESVARPVWYYQQNLGGMAAVLAAAEAAGVKKFVFSSSAAVYGMPDFGGRPTAAVGALPAPVALVRETTPCQPINPYGETKLVGEWLLADCAAAWGLDWVGLRYFNVAGAGWPELGDWQELNLMQMVFARISAGQAPQIFGQDYPTPDGTCVRDYIHVLDLAEAHLQALDYLKGPGIGAGNGQPNGCPYEEPAGNGQPNGCPYEEPAGNGQPNGCPYEEPAGNGRDVSQPRPRIFNVGTGQGYSVQQVVAQIQAVSGVNLTPEILPRRPGDPAQVVADPGLIARELGWVAKHGLPEIVASAWEAWQARPKTDTGK